MITTIVDGQQQQAQSYAGSCKAKGFEVVDKSLQLQNGLALWVEIYILSTSDGVPYITTCFISNYDAM